MSLTVDPSVYLYSAEIAPDRGSRSRLLARSKTETTATWTDLLCCEDGVGDATIAVKWVTVDSISPGRSYCATLSVRDASGSLLAASPGFSNPMDIQRRIGPAADPVDDGRVSIVVAREGGVAVTRPDAGT